MTPRPAGLHAALEFLWRWRTLLATCAMVLVAAALIPQPTTEQLRAWTDLAGPFAPLMFLGIHIVATVTPIPRVVFTLSAGLLFGPVLGVGLALTAATASAVLALLVVRALGRDRVAARLTHPSIRAIDRRLEHRGWLAVGSLRLVVSIPFAIVNYCAALSSVRLLPYGVATVVGLLPGTVCTVLLGDALTGGIDFAALIVSGVFLVVGVIGLVIDAKLDTPIAVEAEPAGR
ncbi:putative membrane protein YdjX (TVP38/TMEM64 family) [Nocardia tenerifensis]|uniref:TVP38/TMEM64 family membrane protein n=1 Tax=Nocardia tenerifensis TaxID=228006 RepID=A0A318K9W7_9NOCA|nr:TVP38/TMEM64 family protein [Nocardia tenerifensis]PXX70886.1 putative membrane protein YdjX (TVP38/TMEM64 family) [Nocardia tenerifensis]